MLFTISFLFFFACFRCVQFFYFFWVSSVLIICVILEICSFHPYCLICWHKVIIWLIILLISVVSVVMFPVSFFILIIWLFFNFKKIVVKGTSSCPSYFSVGVRWCYLHSRCCATVTTIPIQDSLSCTAETPYQWNTNFY